MRFDDLTEINPSVPIRKGDIRPFIDMSALPQHARDVSELGEREFKGSGSRFQNGDTLIARITPCLENGKGALVHSLPEGVPGFGSTEFIVARARSERDTRFVYYLTRSEEFRDIAISRMEGTSGRQRVSWQQIASIEIPDLRPDEREEIGNILGLLDDKIELNRRMAATLEEMARALYRSWFVDFDPVKAKAEGLAPAFMDEATAALFPDRFGDDGLPEGWLVSEIGKELDILDSKRIPLSKGQRNKRNGNIPYYGATSVMDFVDEALFDEVLLLVGEDGSVVRSNGKPFTQYIWGKAWVNNHAHVIKGHRFSVEQLKCIFDEIDIAPFVTGAVQAKLSQGNMKKIPFIEAAPEIHKAYDDQVSRFFEQIRLLSDESETLAELRDSLLPKLMSGELRVGEARDQIEEVA